jgi:LAO/AO transport system kinase
MQSHYLDQGVFIRSLSARGSMGGLARGARDVTRLLDAFGKEMVIVETVGVGQNEFDVMRLAQTVVVVLVPEAGDTVQTMKAGLLEIADVFVVNKADREGAERIQTELFNMLHLRPASGWDVPVLLTVATEGRGIPELVATIEKHRLYLQSSGEGAVRAAAGRRAEFLSLLRDEIGRRLEHGLGQSGGGGDVLGRIERGEIDPYATALEILGDPRWMGRIVRDGRGAADEGAARRKRDA